MSLKNWIVHLESKARWMLGGIALLLVLVIYVLSPTAQWLGVIGKGPKPHDADSFYFSVTIADALLEYPFRDSLECNKYRKELATKVANVSECQSGSQIDTKK